MLGSHPRKLGSRRSNPPTSSCSAEVVPDCDRTISAAHRGPCDLPTTTSVDLGRAARGRHRGQRLRLHRPGDGRRVRGGHWRPAMDDCDPALAAGSPLGGTIVHRYLTLRARAGVARSGAPAWRLRHGCQLRSRQLRFPTTGRRAGAHADRPRRGEPDPQWHRVVALPALRTVPPAASPSAPPTSSATSTNRTAAWPRPSTLPTPTRALGSRARVGGQAELDIALTTPPPGAALAALSSPAP